MRLLHEILNDLTLTLIRLGFMKVAFSRGVGGGQFDPPFIFQGDLPNINITLHNC